MSDGGWWVELDPERAGESHPYVVTLQTGGCCFSLDGLWFATEDDARSFLRDNVIGQGMLD